MLLYSPFLESSNIPCSFPVKVRKFNRQKPPPDVQKEEWITCDNPETMNPNEIGYKQLGDTVVDLLEKQVSLYISFFYSSYSFSTLEMILSQLNYILY